jgi:succinate dehydrogenase / fumarate reductase, flavoprotein subunit
MAVYLDFADSIKKFGFETIQARYGNLFEMYEKITAENPYKTPMRIYPAVHYTMGGLWVDYHLMSNIPGLFVLGEANFSDHGANRLGASALMQGLSDGYFVAPYTVGHYLGGHKFAPVSSEASEFKAAESSTTSHVDRLLGVGGRRSVDSFHRELGHIMWDYCGMGRSAKGLTTAIHRIRALREEFWSNVRVLGQSNDFNQALEHAGRVADFLEFGEMLALDAFHRNESCGGHFREEYQSSDGEAARDDANFSYVAAWETSPTGPVLHKEPLTFEAVKPATRSYK